MALCRQLVGGVAGKGATSPGAVTVVTHVQIEALGIPFQLVGASERNKNFQEMLLENHSCEHLWGDMQEQLLGNACQLHPGADGCVMGGGGKDLDLWVMGTPCPPFSEQTNGRFRPGAVESHPLYHVTFSYAVEAFKMGYKAYVFEQVPGFDKPYSSIDKETPFSRLLGDE